MPDLNLDTITRTATEVARAHAFPVSVVGSVPTSGGSRYIEIVLRVLGCRNEPCRLQLGVFRDVDVESLRLQITSQLRRQLMLHHP
jgi:hypothetical protein